ncbi:hypothetical protein [Pseudoruegeria sp. SK021]|nr:hypothetical protein [Pseudoruegeria sp. SK021]
MQHINLAQISVLEDEVAMHLDVMRPPCDLLTRSLWDDRLDA